MQFNPHDAHRPRVERVVLCGGTHGNERTGVTVVERALLAPDRLNRSTLRTTALITNARAVEKNRRYIDFDLNRCFGRADLNNAARAGYEFERARELNERLGPKGAPATAYDFCIDLHTTTANLGPTVIIKEEDPVARLIAAMVTLRLPDVRVMSYGAAGEASRNDATRDQTPKQEASTNPLRAPHQNASAPLPVGGAPGSAGADGDYPFLAEVTPFGIEIEVGPVSQGVVRQQTVRQTEQIIDAIIDTLDAYNRGALLLPLETLEMYHFTADLDYPRDEQGRLFGMVHPRRQDRDFAPLSKGDPVFLSFDDRVVRYSGDRTVYPVFINEAAYYEKACAMTFTERVTLRIADGNVVR